MKWGELSEAQTLENVVHMAVERALPMFAEHSHLCGQYTARRKIQVLFP